MKKALLIVLTIVLLIVFGVSAYQVGKYFMESREQAGKVSGLSDIVNAAKDNAAETTQGTDPAETTDATEATGETEATEPTEETEPVMLPGYAEVYALNSDLVGWIKIEGTKIDYPVMQTPGSTDFYLKRDFDKMSSDWGCIYVREECDVFAPSDNVTIYGHNMRDGSMFAALHSYKDKKAWDDNPLIFFDTLYEYHVYQIFAVFNTTATIGEGFTYHQMEWAEDEAEFNEFVKTCKDLAMYDTGITPEYGDKLICLSTCDRSLENGRLVVAAVRIS